MSDYLIQRNGIYYYQRRIPVDIAHLDKRKFAKYSLKTRNRKEAIRRAIARDDFLETKWQGMRENIIERHDPYLLSTLHAEAVGLTYRTAQEISEREIERVVNRVIHAVKSFEDPQAISAVLGGENHPTYTLEEVWQDYYKFKEPSLSGKSSSQLKRWVNPRVRAYKTFIDVCGDIPVEKITRDDILKFRAWWADRILTGMAPNSANKDLTHLRTLLTFAQDNKSGICFDTASLFARVRFEESDSERQPFPTQFIRAKILNTSLLNGLNYECKLFLYAMADTGARPSELLGLSSKRGDIQLHGEIPFIHIRPDDNREIKNKYSNRQIPLVGSALEAFKHIQSGFVDYYQKPDQLSSILNRFLRDRGLLPSKNHSVYSLRHSFEDRLCEVNTIEKVQSAIMGHSYRRERYGLGPSLEQKKFWMDKMCFSDIDISKLK